MRKPKINQERAIAQESAVIYVALGYEFLLMAINSAKSCNKHNGDLVVVLVTDQDWTQKNALVKEVFDKIYVEEIDRKKNRLLKVRAPSYTMEKRGVYLDCDTVVHGSIEPLLGCLDHFDIVVKMNSQFHRKNFEIAQGIPSYLFPFWNGGMVAFRNDEVGKSFFSNWEEKFRSMGVNTDQPALTKTIFECSNIRVLSVNAIWNQFPADQRLLSDKKGFIKPHIQHYRSVEQYPEVAEELVMLDSIICSTETDLRWRDNPDVREFLARLRLCANKAYKVNWLRPFYLRYVDWRRRMRGEKVLTRKKPKEVAGQKIAEISDHELRKAGS